MRLTAIDGGVVTVPPRELDDLGARVVRPLLRRGDPGFDAAVWIWNAMAAKTPALVVQPVCVDDVVEAIGFARDRGILLSIKGGGHNIAGTSLADGALTLDMSRWRDVEVDPRQQVAHVAPGCVLRDVDRATQEHGLATVLGFVSETGVAGLTLGGGFGYLTRRFGWTVDNLEEAEVVTADGVARRAAADEHEDLFWALRGGGGNFGVVTRFTFRLHEVGPDVTAGVLMWDADDAAEVLAVYRELAEAAPRELALGVLMRRAPAAPFVPDRWHGEPIVGVLACHSGDPDCAERDLAPLRALRRPIVDALVRKRYVEQQSMLDATQPKGLHNYWKSEFVPPLSSEFLDVFRQQAAGIASPMSVLWTLQLGGALADRDEDATAFGNRDAEAIVAAAACWAPGVADHERDRAWARTAWEAFRPHSTGGNYVNVQTADDDDARLREAYRDTLDRLSEVKAAYDPENLFRVNRNIAPAGFPRTALTEGAGSPARPAITPR